MSQSLERTFSDLVRTLSAINFEQGLIAAATQRAEEIEFDSEFSNKAISAEVQSNEGKVVLKLEPDEPSSGVTGEGESDLEAL